MQEWEILFQMFDFQNHLLPFALAVLVRADITVQQHLDSQRFPYSVSVGSFPCGASSSGVLVGCSPLYISAGGKNQLYALELSWEFLFS